MSPNHAVIPMKQTRILAASIVAFVYTMSMLGYAAAQPSTATITTNQPIYALWRIGGTIHVITTNLEENATYYLWLQKPGDASTHIYGSGFGPAGRTTVTIDLILLPTDPAGTYLLSLSRSNSLDTKESFAHFGVLGPNARSYERTQEARIEGGGFAANSTIIVDIRNATTSLQGFPARISTQGNGDFAYVFKLRPQTQAGTLNLTVFGPTADIGRNVTVSTAVEVRPTTIKVQPVTAPSANVERTGQVSATYLLIYPDGTPVQNAFPTAQVVTGQRSVANISLLLVNSTRGLWRASWTPPESAPLSQYQFQLSQSNLRDIYGNFGTGGAVASSTFTVLRATLDLSTNANQTIQRTENATFAVGETYHNGMSANITESSMELTQSDGKQYSVPVTFNGTAIITQLKIPVNASLGLWTVDYSLTDAFGNSGSGRITFQVVKATLVFAVNFPVPAERTTLANITAVVTYPDKTQLSSGVKLTISQGNQTWSPDVHFNSTTSQFQAQYYLSQNATIGPYNLTLTAADISGNSGNFNGFMEVVPARLRFVLPSNNATVSSLGTFDLPITVRYPNSTSLTNSVGSVFGSYTNSTGGTVDLPMVFNQTDSEWHLYYQVPEEGNVTFSFRASDHYGNAGFVEDAFNLKINPSSRILTQRLIIAGIVGALVPIALLIWAIATISTRRRKHRP